MVQGGGVASKHLLDRLRIETLQDVADGGMGGCALPVQAEGGVQSATVHLDERLDGAEGIAAGDHSKDGEQQKIGQLVEFAFSPARVRNLAECCKELIERSHDNLLVIWLPGIDSENLPRRNPAPRSVHIFYSTVAPRTQHHPSDV